MDFLNNVVLIFNELIETVPAKVAFAMGMSTLMLLSHASYFKFLINRSSIFLTLMLPATVLLVTQAIATNFYLSLGLIGALSIVRYRTPVKSQYELAYLFALIGVGVISGVNPGFAALLVMILCVIPIAYKLLISVVPSLGDENSRVDSDGRAEVTVLLHEGDESEISVENMNGQIIRIDKSYEAKQTYVLLRFESFSAAVKFESTLSVQPISLSISSA
jgi:uncharacterized membrane protein YhiD involved in acid resistance